MKRLVCGVDTGLREVTFVLLDCETGKTPRYLDGYQCCSDKPLITESQCRAAYDWQMEQLETAITRVPDQAYFAVEMYGWQGGKRARGTVHVGPQIARMGGALEQRLVSLPSGEKAVAVSRNEALSVLGCVSTKELNGMLNRMLGKLPSEHHYAAAAVAWTAFLGMR